MPDEVVPQGFEVVMPENLFEVYLEENSRTGNTLYLGFKLPQGWEVNDPIPFVGDINGIFIYSDKRTSDMEQMEPAEHGFYWWVGETTPPLTISCGSIYCYPKITTDDKTGNFLIDYMLGYNGTLNTSRWNNQFINIGTEDTVYVTSTHEYGQGSIREAIETVKDGGVILFDFQNPETILITEEIWIYKDIVIRGEEQMIPSISSENPCRILKINNDLKVELSNLKISNGFAELGGGLYCGVRSEVSLNNITFDNNEANLGGGVYCDRYSTTNFINTIFSANSASDGGGIYCQEKAMVTLENCMIKENVASGFGGGLYCNISRVMSSDVTLTKNSAIRGGAIYSNGSNIFLENVNVCKNDAELGGGIFFDNNPDPILKNVFITENEASGMGGGLYINNSFPQFDANERCNIYLNGSMNGSDLYTTNFVEVVVDTFTVITPNKFHTTPFDLFSFDILHGKIQQANEDLYVSPTGDNTASGLNENEPLKNIWFAFSKILADSLHVNTIFLSEGTYSPTSNDEIFPVNIPDYVFIEGISENSTIVDAEGNESVFRIDGLNNTGIYNLTIRGGSSLKGGGIYCYNSDPVFQNLIIESNIATQGGGLFCLDSRPEIQDVSFFGNTAKDGGGILLINSNPNLSNLLLAENQADNGGGILCKSSNPYLNNVTIHDNIAVRGGGIYFYQSLPVLFKVDIFNNTADSRGGAVYYYQSNAVFITGNIYNNSADENGGGFFVSISEPLFYNIIFSNNSTKKRGGGIYCTGSNFFLSNVTINNNMALLEGGGVYGFINNNFIITNSILWNNSPEEVYLSKGYNSNTFTLSYSDIKGDTAGIVGNEGNVNWLNGNIAEDPLFCGSGNDPCDLLEFSPCIDAGNPDTTGLNLPPWDFSGDNRIEDGNGDGLSVVDMGAYEFAGGFVGVGKLQVTGCRLQVFPNPSCGISDIRYQISDVRYVSLEIYKVHGQRIRMLVNKKQQPGEYSVRFDGSDLPAGIYLVRLQAGEELETMKLVVLR